MEKRILLAKYYSGIINNTRKDIYLIEDEEETVIEGKDKDGRATPEVFYLENHTNKEIDEICRIFRKMKKKETKKNVRG